MPKGSKAGLAVRHDPASASAGGQERQEGSADKPMEIRHRLSIGGIKARAHDEIGAILDDRIYQIRALDLDRK